VAGGQPTDGKGAFYPPTLLAGVNDAQQEIAAAAKAARRELTAYAADLAVGLAQKQIRVDAPTDQVLVRHFAQQLSADGGEKRKGGQ